MIKLLDDYNDTDEVEQARERFFHDVSKNTFIKLRLLLLFK